MGLLDLKTDLKSLKYGKDTPGGGSSGQPYIQTDINTVDQGFNRLRLTKFDDGLIRGGAVGALNASVVDTLRIGKFLKDLPKGPLFIVKQVGLQLSNPKLETAKITLSQGSGILNFINNLANKVNSNFGPTRIYNLGINTLAQVPVNAFGKHFNRHGLTPIQDDSTKYFAVVNYNNKSNQNIAEPSNRLVALQTKFQLGVKYSNLGFNTSPILNRTQQLLRRINPLTRIIGGLIGGGVGRAITNISRISTLFFNNNNLTIDNYLGGPGSTYGIGKTLIQRYDITERGEKINKTFEKSNTVSNNAKVRWDIGAGLSQKGPSISTGDDGTYDILNPSVENQNSILTNSVSPALKSYKAIQDAVRNLPKSNPVTIPFSTSTSNKIGFGPFKNKQFTPEVNSGLDRTPPTPFRYYEKATPSSDGSQLVYKNSNTYSRIDSDILTIGFRIIDPFSLNEDKIFLSAYMKGFKEDFNATWNDINYAGRAESFYIYNKFKRTVSFNLQIPCFNRKELFEKHRALGQLAATTAGSYNSQGFLGGVLIRLNVGNYIVGEYSILNSLNYSIPDDSSWDITPEGRLAMLIDTSFNFTIIHKELPQYQSEQGFFKYLPDTYNGYILKNNRSERQQAIINQTFIPDNYGEIDTLVTSASISEFIRNSPSIPQIEFKPTISRTINTPDKLKSIDVRTGKTPNQLRGYVDNPIFNPILPSSQTSNA